MIQHFDMSARIYLICQYSMKMVLPQSAVPVPISLPATLYI